VRQEPVLGVAPAAAEDVARIALVDLVTRDVLRVRQDGPVAGVLDLAARLLHEAQAAVGEEGEVGPQAPLVALRVPVPLPGVRRGWRGAAVEEQVLAVRAAALGRVDGAELVQLARCHETSGYLS